MRISLLQLNIEAGRKLPLVISFIKKKSYDIVHLQEVAGGEFAYEKQDCFSLLKKETGYEGVLSVDMSLKDTVSYYGNATLFSSRIKKSATHIVSFLPPKQYLSKQEVVNEEIPRSAVVTSVRLNSKIITTINTHLVWGQTPEDTEQKLEVGKKLVQLMKTVPEPYILTGDFNVAPTSQIISWLKSFGRNLTLEQNITNTLNPHLHKASHIFPPGIVSDYVVVSNSLSVFSFQLIDSPDLSDHFGLAVEIEVL